jgi:hypothetical protein
MNVPIRCCSRLVVESLCEAFLRVSCERQYSMVILVISVLAVLVGAPGACGHLQLSEK